MANDLTFGMDVVIDKILGLGQFDALGKKIQSVVAKAVQAGLLEGVPEAREMLREVYGTSTVAGRDSAIKRLYAHGVRVEAAKNKEIARELAADARRAEREAASLAKAEAKQAERREKFEAAAAAYQLYSPYATTSATASYAESTIARQHLQYMTRITNRDLISDANLRTATTQQLIERSRSNYEAANIRYDLPFNRLAREVAEAERQADRNAWRAALQSEDELARQIYEAEHGAVSDRAWRLLSAQEAFGASKAQAAWERGARRDAALEAERNAQRRKESASNVSVFGELADEVDDVTDSLKGLTLATRASTMVFSAGAALTTGLARSFWQQELARNVTASNLAYLQRWQIAANVGGGLVGALGGMAAGAAAGSGFMGIGAIPGAIIGGAIGALGGGSLAGLPAEKSIKKLEGALKTVALTTAARRDYLLYGGSSGFSLGMAMEDAGFGTAADLNNMRWTSQTLPGAMALGMVGEQDMLMLSLMPEYFAALMGGADAATLAAAYQKSVQHLPAQLRPLVATMAPGGSQGMYANAIDPQYSNMLTSAPSYALADRYFANVSERVMAASIRRAETNVGLERAATGKIMTQAMLGMHEDYFDMSYMSPSAAWADAMTLYHGGKTLTPEEANGIFDAATHLLNTAKVTEGLDILNKVAQTGLNLTIRVEGIGDVTQNFPFSSMADGQSVSFNIGAQ